MQLYGVPQQQFSNSIQGCVSAPQSPVNPYQLDKGLLLAQQQLLEEQEQLLLMQERELQLLQANGRCNPQQRQYGSPLGSANRLGEAEFGLGAVAAVGIGGKRRASASGGSEAGLAAWELCEEDPAMTRGPHAPPREFQEQGKERYQVGV